MKKSNKRHVKQKAPKKKVIKKASKRASPRDVLTIPHHVAEKLFQPHFGTAWAGSDSLPVSPQRQEMFRQHDAQNRQAISRAAPIRTREDERGHEEYMRDSVRGLSDTELLNIIDRESHKPVPRKNPIREHWEKYGDQDYRPVPPGADAILDEVAKSPESQALRDKIKNVLKGDQ